MHEQAAEVLRVLLDPVVLRFDLFALKEPQHVLLELARALTGDDLDERGLLRLRLVDDRLQRPVDVLPAVVDVVQVKLQLHGHRPAQATVARWSSPPWRPGGPPGPRSARVRLARASPGHRTVS